MQTEAIFSPVCYTKKERFIAAQKLKNLLKQLNKAVAPFNSKICIMKSFIKKLYFDKEMVNKIRAAKVNKHRLRNMLESGKITLIEYLKVGIENSNRPL